MTDTTTPTPPKSSFFPADLLFKLEAMAHLRDLGPRYKALYDKIAKEIEEYSASLEPKPIVQAPPPAVVAAQNPKPLSPEQAKAMAEQAAVRRAEAARNAEVLSGRPTPAVGQPDMTDAEWASRNPGSISPGPVDIDRRV